MGNIGILGSYFDPIHEGHIKIAKQSLEKFDLDKVLFVPVVNGIRKSPKASIEDRINMILMNIDNNKMFELNNTEQILIDRGEKDFTSFDVLSNIKKDYEDDRLFYIIGADKLNSLDNWRNFSEFNKLIEIILSNRDGYSIDYNLLNNIKNKYNINISTIEDNTLLCSSSLIRNKIIEKDFTGFDYLLQKSVLDYIIKNSIY